jgi:hypothetical protein
MEGGDWAAAVTGMKPEAIWAREAMLSVALGRPSAALSGASAATGAPIGMGGPGSP